MTHAQPENGIIYQLEGVPERPAEYCFTFNKSYPCDGVGDGRARRAGYCLCHEAMENYETDLALAIKDRVQWEEPKEVLQRIADAVAVKQGYDFGSPLEDGIELVGKEPTGELRCKMIQLQNIIYPLDVKSVRVAQLKTVSGQWVDTYGGVIPECELENPMLEYRTIARLVTEDKQ